MLAVESKIGVLAGNGVNEATAEPVKRAPTYVEAALYALATIGVSAILQGHGHVERKQKGHSEEWP